jgi:ABC-type nitrate/sulfonate/bicarbonate transport system permease component
VGLDVPDPDTGPPASPAAGRWRSLVLAALPPLAVVAALALVWQFYATHGGPGADVLPSLSRVASQGYDHRRDLWHNLLPTLRATLTGFGCSLVVGFALSVLIDASRLARRAVMPLLVVSQTLPLSAIAPLVVLWFGFGLLPKVFVVALVTFFPITVALVEGYASADPDSETLLRTMGAGRARVFRVVRLPSALPYFFAGLRIAITYAVVAAIFAEYAGATSGLGIYMQTQKNSFRTDLVLAAVAVSAAMTLVLFGLTYVIEWIALPSRRAGRGQGRAEAVGAEP